MTFRRPTGALARCSAEVLAGRYRLDAVIGSGGAGVVHRGFDLRLRRPVAVKMFRADADTGLEESFHNEAVILARLHHPGLVTVYDAGRHNGRAYQVMELIEGPTLKHRIAAGPLTPGETAALGAGLARALAHAHEAGIVHRDVKPSNIILDAAGRPHLTDFGISRLLDATTRTATGTLVGTAAYLSPEQVLGQPVGPPADVYALGLVLLECVTSRVEYDGGPLESAIARLHRRPELPGSLPEQLAELLRDMTALEVPARPSADDCARTLDALAGTAEAAPAPARVTSPVPRETPVRADVTHRRPSWTTDTAPPKTAPARGRRLVAGGAVALAAVMATTIAASDGTRHQGGGGETTRAAGSPSATDRLPGTAGTGGAGSAAPTPSARDASGRQSHEPTREQSAGPAATTLAEVPAAESGTPAPASPLSHRTGESAPDPRNMDPTGPRTSATIPTAPTSGKGPAEDTESGKNGKPGKAKKAGQHRKQGKPEKADKAEKAGKATDKPGKGNER
ncbi:protein kinase [Streptomyces sp. NPDC017082]|uniref:protein kinase domain-containing protein n=1 Tax=Streptomyces sp. NPDC017082 TaxID=3364974 RepID=UPI0037B7EEC6